MFRPLVLAAAAVVLLAGVPQGASLPSNVNAFPCRPGPAALLTLAMDRRDLVNSFTGLQVRDCATGAVAMDASATFASPARFEGGFAFDGTGQFLLARDPTLGNIAQGDFTVMAWVRLDPQWSWPTPGEYHTVLSKGFAANDFVPGYGLRIHPDGVSNHFILHDGAHQHNLRVYFAAQVVDGAWHHLAVSADRDGSAVVYVDGVEVARQRIAAQAGSLSNRWPLAVGMTTVKGPYMGKDPYLENGLRGVVDEVRVHGKALSLCEVRSLAALPYESPFLPGVDPFAGLPPHVCRLGVPPMP